MVTTISLFNAAVFCFVCELNTVEKFSDAGIQDVSTSISIRVKFEEMTGDDDDEDESDKHLEARDRRYSCLKSST